MSPAKGYGLSREERVRGRDRVTDLFSHGRGGFVYPFKYLCLAGEKSAHDGVLSVLITVPKKNIKKANKRNLLKRRTREAFRLAKGEADITVNKDIALIYVSKGIEEYHTIRRAVGKIVGSVASSG